MGPEAGRIGSLGEDRTPCSGSADYYPEEDMEWIRSVADAVSALDGVEADVTVAKFGAAKIRLRFRDSPGLAMETPLFWREIMKDGYWHSKARESGLVFYGTKKRVILVTPRFSSPEELRMKLEIGGAQYGQYVFYGVGQCPKDWTVLEEPLL